MFGEIGPDHLDHVPLVTLVAIIVIRDDGQVPQSALIAGLGQGHGLAAL